MTVKSPINTLAENAINENPVSMKIKLIYIGFRENRYMPIVVMPRRALTKAAIENTYVTAATRLRMHPAQNSGVVTIGVKTVKPSSAPIGIILSKVVFLLRWSTSSILTPRSLSPIVIIAHAKAKIGTIISHSDQMVKVGKLNIVVILLEKNSY